MCIFAVDEDWVKSLEVDINGVITGYREKQSHAKSDPGKEKKNHQQHDRNQRRLDRQARQIEEYQKQLHNQEQQLRVEHQQLMNEKKNLSQQQQQQKLNEQQDQNEKTEQQQNQDTAHHLQERVPVEDSKVPLYPGSKMLLKNTLLMEITKQLTKNPKQIIRCLLLEFIGREELKLMTRTGKNDREQIPEDCINEIKGEWK